MNELTIEVQREASSRTGGEIGEISLLLLLNISHRRLTYRAGWEMGNKIFWCHIHDYLYTTVWEAFRQKRDSDRVQIVYYPTL